MDEFITKLRKQEQDLLILQQQVTKELEEAPPGGLKIRKNKGKIQYLCTGKRKEERYIKKSEMELAYSLAQKSYLKQMNRNIGKQLFAVQTFLRWYSPTALTDPYERLSTQRKELVKSVCLTDQQYIEWWMSSPYSGKGFGNDDPVITTERGERVRSKSEKIIADKLFMLGIPYKYECPVRIDRVGFVYPDFTILDVRERRVLYLEHLGMMDEQNYSNMAVRKIDSYIKSGIIPGKDLILTYETSKIPLDVRNLERILESYGLIPLEC